MLNNSVVLLLLSIPSLVLGQLEGAASGLDSRCYCLTISVLNWQGVGGGAAMDGSDPIILVCETQKSQTVGTSFTKNLENLLKEPTKGTKCWLVPMALPKNGLTELGQ